jgi:hypothetical protein
VAGADVAGVEAGELPGDGVTDELRKLDPDEDRNALGASEAEGAADDRAAGEGAAGDGREAVDAAGAGAGVVAAVPAPARGWAWLEGGVRSAPIMAKAATPEATTSTPLTHAEASGREMRCRPGRPGRTDGGRPETASVGARPLPASAGPSGPASGSSWPEPLMTDSGSQSGAGWMAPTWASSSRALGRSPGSLARQLPTSARSSAGTPPRSGRLLTSRYMSAGLDPEPNGPSPVAAKVSTAPRLNMSLGGPMS